MGKRGPQPAPIPLRILRGDGRGHDVMGRDIPVAPAFEREAPDPPDWLSDEARALWDRITPSLQALDLLKPEDYTTFVAYCECWSTYVEMLAQVRRHGATKTTAGTGVERKTAAQQAVETSNTQLVRFAQQFGLTPAAEVALAKPVRPGAGEDAFAGGEVDIGS